MALQQPDSTGIGAAPAGKPDRRRDERESVLGDIWLIDVDSSAVVRCRCVDVSGGGMALRVPIGHGIGVGRTFELFSSLPGAASRPAGLIISRKARVVRTDFHSTSHDEMLVGLTFEAGAARRMPYRESAFIPS